MIKTTGAFSELDISKTGLRECEHRKIIRSSDGHNWSGLAAAEATLLPHEDASPIFPHLWLSLMREDATIDVERDGHNYRTRLKKDTVVIGAPSIRTYVSLKQPATFIHALISREVLGEVVDDLYGKSLANVEIKSPADFSDPVLSHLMFACGELLREPSGGYRTECLSRAIAAQVLRHHSELSNYRRLRDSQIPLSQAQMKIVDDFLRSNIHGDFQYGELASAVGLSRTIFFERFSRAAGQSPHRYFQTVRLAQAKRLLRDGTLSIADVAAACGYSDQSHLTRSFKRFVGLTPRRFRSMQR